MPSLTPFIDITIMITIIITAPVPITLAITIIASGTPRRTLRSFSISVFGGFPKLEVPLWESLSFKRITVFWGLYWDCPIYGNDHFQIEEAINNSKSGQASLSYFESNP